MKIHHTWWKNYYKIFITGAIFSQKNLYVYLTEYSIKQLLVEQQISESILMRIPNKPEFPIWATNKV